MANWFDRVGEDLVLLRSDLAKLKDVVATRRVALKNFYWLQPRDYHGRWTLDGGKDPNVLHVGQQSRGTDNATKRERHRGITDFSAAKRRLEADCDLQYAKDTMLCNLVKTPLCWAQAMERYSACLSGRPIPQLRF